MLKKLAILSVTVLMAACGAHEHKSSISKTLGGAPDPSSTKGKLAKAMGTTCLDLFAVVSTLITGTDKVVVYTYDLDIQKINPARSALEPITDDVARGKYLLQQVKPQFNDELTGQTLQSSTDVGPLLMVTDHDQCTSVTFSDGASGAQVFKVDLANSGRGVVTLISSDGREVRKYTLNNDNHRLIVQLVHPASPDLCGGAKASGLVLKQTTVVGFGSERLSMSRGLVALMDKFLTLPTELKNQLKTEFTPAPAVPVKPGVGKSTPPAPIAAPADELTLTTADYLKIERLIEHNEFHGLQCK